MINKQFASLLSIFTLSIILQSCGNKSGVILPAPIEIPVLTEPLEAAPELPSIPHLPPLFVEGKKETIAPDTQEVDIVISIDNSGSMYEEIGLLEQNINLFVKGLKERALKFQLSMIMSSDDDNGKHSPLPFGDPSFISHTFPSPERWASERVNEALGLSKGGFERPLSIFVDMLTDTRNWADVAPLRKQTAKFFFMLSDAEENLNDKPAIDYFETIEKLNDNYPIQFIAVGSPNDKPCQDAESISHYLINEVVRLSGGQVFRLCDPSYGLYMAESLKGLEKMLQSFSFSGLLPLPFTVGPENLLVFINDRPIKANDNGVYGYRVNWDEHRILFGVQDAPKKNDRVQIKIVGNIDG